ncbi:hypothetical protein C8A03DRAFT_18836 [Achaetomium macrosporum]|uniref:FAD-binding domain-containing protein n=1 Tax=Achaetomium macrosporum TaxID=79813 RepID=A0AAN7C3S2_9PEZI|nr:hypothetical protein C8A03DRAFT_18836 [Achaetomium macrosporum]
MALNKVIIVGAGPSGLLLALLLARAHIPVEVLEQTHSLDTNPRASHYTAESCMEFDRAGILDEVRAQGFTPDGVSWRRLDDERKTRLVMLRNAINGPDSEEGRYRMVCLPLHKLGKILERRVLEQPGAEIKYGHRVVEIGEDKERGKAWVRVEKEFEGGGETREEEVREADYVVGCDGANSTIRRKLFGEMVFPGFTWDKQIVATNMYYDFEPYDYDDSQFFVHPEHWHMVAKIQTDGLTRVTYGEIGGLTYDQLKERQPAKFQAFLPGNPTPDKYRLVNFSPYKVHQRCVDKMRVGRFILAADAAHLCNPFGGMGLTGGIADVGSLYDSLVGIHTGMADDSILDKYDEVRRRIWHDIINPISSENMSRLFKYSGPDEAMEKDPFFKMVTRMQNPKDGEDEPPNPGLPSLRYDMTQHYNR